jgi:hypothetical protein
MVGPVHSRCNLPWRPYLLRHRRLSDAIRVAADLSVPHALSEPLASMMNRPTSAYALALAALIVLPHAGDAAAQSRARKEEPKPPYMQAQCQWSGTRVVHSLMREDTLAAQDHLKFYQQFKCPEEHLTKAFACAIDVPVGTVKPKADVLVTNCWQTLTPNRESEEDDEPPARKPAR